tara:strand:+ start:13278 stop:14201 length:924 start_codon:yes stop_codon:yes gene_type:complete
MKLIFGASGQIGKSLIKELIREGFLYLVTSSRSKLETFLGSQNIKTNFKVIDYDYKSKFSFPSKIKTIINCSGKGDPNDHKSDLFLLNDLTGNIDKQILEFLERNKDVSYFFLSTGGLYNSEKNYSYARQKRTMNINLDNLLEYKFYLFKKLSTERLHESFKHLKIINIRIFGFISEFISFKSGFFIAQVLESLQKKKTFFTGKKNFIRDYITGSDLAYLINLLETKKTNFTLDVFSNGPVTKKEILEIFIKKGLNLSINIEEIQALRKPKYISNCSKGISIGFKSKYNSIKNIENLIRNLKLYTNK